MATKAKTLKDAVPPKASTKGKVAGTQPLGPNVTKRPKKVVLLGSTRELQTTPSDVVIDEEALALRVDLGLFVGAANGNWTEYKGSEYLTLFATGDEYGRTQWRKVTAAEVKFLGIPGLEVGDEVGMKHVVKLRRPTGRTERATSTKGKGKKEVTIDADVLASLIEVVKASQK